MYIVYREEGKEGEREGGREVGKEGGRGEKTYTTCTFQLHK